MKRIPVAGPWITQKEIDYVTDAVTNCWYENAHIYHQRFEAAFAQYVGRKFAVALPSCTAAIHLALASLNIGPGDEVIVPDITWIATSAPVSYVGAQPVFADVDERTWCLSVESFEKNITPRTRAAILVDLYGNMPDMDAILGIAEKHAIAVVEDAAQAIGSEYKNKRAGSFGVASTFSFHGSKTLTTGEGGVLVTDSEKIHKRCLFLRDHGREPGSIHFWNTEVAYKYRMSSMQAALGLAQMQRIEELLKKKRETFNWYHELLKDVPGVSLNYEPPTVKNTYWMVTAVLDPQYGIRKEELMERLSQKGIDTRPFFHPLSMLPAYEHLPRVKQARERNANAYRFAPYGINLPSSLSLTQDQIAYVCEKFTDILRSVASPRR